MTGGRVTEAIILADKVWVNVESAAGDPASARALYVCSTAPARCISEGDDLRWSGEMALWTPRDRRGRIIGPKDVRIRRIGAIGVRRPSTANT